MNDFKRDRKRRPLNVGDVVEIVAVQHPYTTENMQGLKCRVVGLGSSKSGKVQISFLWRGQRNGARMPAVLLQKVDKEGV